MSWLEHYRTNKNAVWIKARLCIGEWVYLDDLSDGWTDLVERCNTEDLYIKHISFQFRSHEVTMDLDDIDGIYLTKGCKGQLGGDSTELIIFGKIKDGEVHKDAYIIPDLIIDHSYVDSISNCIEEAILYDKKKTQGNGEE